MAIEQQATTLQEAEAAIKAGRNSEGERILKQIIQSDEGKCICLESNETRQANDHLQSQVKGRKRHCDRESWL